jgi:hypothetical protein
VTLARVPAPVEGEVAPRAPRREARSLRGPVAGVIAGLAVAGAAIGGYALGDSGRHSGKEAAAEQRSAEQRAYAAGLREAAARGRRDGFRSGAAAGTAAGTRAGSRGRAGTPAPKSATATPPPGAVKTCPNTPIRKKTFVSSVRGISCVAAAAETQQALKAGHPTRTAKGFTCQKIDAQHYRCTHGAAAYRWDISP